MDQSTQTFPVFGAWSVQVKVESWGLSWRLLHKGNPFCAVLSSFPALGERNVRADVDYIREIPFTVRDKVVKALLLAWANRLKLD